MRIVRLVALLLLVVVTIPAVSNIPPVEEPADAPWDTYGDYGNLPSGVCSYCAQWACGCPTPAEGFSLSASCECGNTQNRICRRTCTIEPCDP